MNIRDHFKFIGRVGAFALVVICLASATEIKGQGVLKEVLDRMDANYKGLSSLESDVTLVKYNSQINKSDTSIGSTSFLPKSSNKKNLMYVRIDWVKPIAESIVVIGEEYVMYRPTLNQVVKGKANSSKNSKVPGNALAFVSMSKAQLQTNYKVDYVAQETISGGIQTWHLLLTPKVATSYKTAELWVDKDGMPRQAKINENNDDSTTILLSRITTNQKLDTAKFKLSYPKGVTIVNG